jgi:DNA-binding HxlR family transcriptional regulator
MSNGDKAVKKEPESHQVPSAKPSGAKAMQIPNPYDADCPTRMILDRIGDKWAVLVLGLLENGPVRFNQLRRRIEGLSQKMLSQTLKNLERDGLVDRRAFPTVPVTVEYSITALGRTLGATLDSLRLWAETHIADVQAAQKRYDTRPGQGGTSRNRV